MISLFSSLWVAQLSDMSFDCITSAPLLPSRGFFFMCLDVEYLFWVDSSHFMGSCLL